MLWIFVPKYPVITPNREKLQGNIGHPHFFFIFIFYLKKTYTNTHMHVYVTWWCIKKCLIKYMWGQRLLGWLRRIWGFHCRCNILLPVWSRNSGVWMSWDSRLVKELVTNTRNAERQPSGLNSSAAFILESNRRLLPFGEKPKSVETNGLRLNVRRTGRMFCKDCYCCWWCCCTGRGCTKEREWQQTKSKRRRATKEGNAGHVCAKKRCPRSVTHLSNSVVHASFMLFWGSSSSSRTWKNKRECIPWQYISMRKWRDVCAYSPCSFPLCLQ